MSWMHGMRARLRLLFRGAAERRMAEELAFHLEMETEKNLRAGMSPAEARRQARLAFGGVEGHKEAVRDGWTFPWAGGLSLDFKLGVRMLRKYPGLTLVGGLAMAFAIWVGAGTFEVLSQVVHPSLPLPGGDRIVGLRQWDARESGATAPRLNDVATWRTGLRTVRDVGAFRTVSRNLIAPGLPIRPVVLAEMSASGFRVAGVAPRLGRTLLDADELPGAPGVVVLGHELWKGRFGADPAVVGRQVRLGSTTYTIVGVMPRDFGFPIAHELWTPLRRSELDAVPGAGAGVGAFGRLAPGATLAEARAELATLARRAAADHPETHRHLRSQVMPYANTILDLSGAEAAVLMSVNLFLVMLLVLVCGNVALLTFARAVSREGELAVRSALGASRGRIIAQLFAEALVLVGVAAVVGLTAANVGLRWMLGASSTTSFVTGLPGFPFWIRDHISPATIVYAGLLTVVGALVAGVLPALKVTRSLGPQLRQASAGGGGYRFGGLWTAVIVAQVAVTVVFPAVAVLTQREGAREQSRDVGFPTEEYLSVRLAMDPADAAPGTAADTSRAAHLARVAATAAELERRLEADPAVLGVAFAERMPRMVHPYGGIELDAGGAEPIDPAIGIRRVSFTSVALDYFSVVGAPVLRGRGFHAGDLNPNARVVIVNGSFVQRQLGGRNPIGRHLRLLPRATQGQAAAAEEQPWYEIVGVVPDLGMGMEPEGFYLPATAGDASPLYMVVHVRGQPAALAPRLRTMAAALDPTLQLHELVPLDQVNADRFLVFWFWLIMLVSGVALLLSLAGIYAVMSFTVSRRTREIGVRVALGADARRLVAAIFRRPLTQVAMGIVAGAAVVALLPLVVEMEELSAKGTGVVAGYAVFMMCVCLLACIVPTRRALRIEPTEALRAE
jgi:putative ABC transport system permease protein